MVPHGRRLHAEIIPPGGKLLPHRTLIRQLGKLNYVISSRTVLASPQIMKRSSLVAIDTIVRDEAFCWTNAPRKYIADMLLAIRETTIEAPNHAE